MKNSKRRKSIKSRAIGTIVALLLATAGFILVPYAQQYLPDRSGGEVQADVPQIKGSMEEGFDYEYEASTFDVFLGKKNEKPRFKVEQGLRSLDIMVIPGLGGNVVPEVLEDTEEVDEEEVTDVEATPTPSPTPTPDNSPTPTPEVDAEISPTPTPDNSPTPTPTPNDEGAVEGTSDEILIESPALDPTVEPLSWRWPFWGEAHAQQEPTLINAKTEPAVDFTNDDLVVTPNLDKVKLDLDVVSKDDMPSFDIQSENLVARLENENKAVFVTRTNRKAFALTNGIITGKNGQSSPIILEIQDKTNYENRGLSVPSYTITITPGKDWKELIGVYPATVQIDLVSLFHDKMLPIRPVKKDFTAQEPIEVKVDMTSIDNEEMAAALGQDDLSDINFGLIDVGGNTAELKAKVKERSEGSMIVELTLPKPQEAVGGIFDLLIQKGEKPAYISEEDFSWGVLTINPDQAVYQLNSKAKIDMAVLDPMGHMVCNADLTLAIEDPTGAVTTLTRADDSITMTEGCFNLVTNLADYTTTYQTGPVGVYTLTLTAVTNNGSFTIQDSFEVDPDAPYYIKRLGPTRIFPLLDYQMTLEITAAKPLDRIQELAPSDFKITMLDGGYVVEESFGVDDTQEMVWKQSLQAGETMTVRYTFDAPNISPALFLLGPATIFGPDFAAGYQEARQWQIASDAIGQEASNSTSWDTTTDPTLTLTVTAGSLVIVQVFTDDGETMTISDSNGDTYTSENSAGGTSDVPRVEQFSNNNPTASSKTITINGTSSGSAGAVSLTGTDTTIPVDASSKVGTTGNLGGAGNVSHSITTDQNNSWMMSVTGQDTNSTITKDASQTQIWAIADGGADKHAGAGSSELQTPAGADTQLFAMSKGGDWALSSIEVNVMPSTDPVTADLMRHGNYFESGAEQKFFWAN